eukprot:5739652-Pleurochrysis_carterae.AAC.2
MDIALSLCCATHITTVCAYQCTVVLTSCARIRRGPGFKLTPPASERDVIPEFRVKTVVHSEIRLAHALQRPGPPRGAHKCWTQRASCKVCRYPSLLLGSSTKCPASTADNQNFQNERSTAGPKRRVGQQCSPVGRPAVCR